MKIWKLILATLAIFSAGVLTGSLLPRLANRPQHDRPAYRSRETAGHNGWGGTNSLASGTNRNQFNQAFGTRPPFRSAGKEFLERLERELKLEPEQRKQIEKILSESQKRNKEIWEKIAPEMREEMKKSHDRIRQVLTPDQDKRFEELMKRQPKPGEGRPPRESASTNAVPEPPVKL